MAMNRGTLAKIDRRILSEFDHLVGVQLVKVPVSDAVWSTWRRYCEVIGLTMGAGIGGLIDHELRTVVGESGGEDGPVFAGRAEDQVAAREARLATNEGDLEATEERLRGWEEQLRSREGQLRALELKIRAGWSQSSRPKDLSRKVGRNERCPCGSGLKYKHCHGLDDGRTGG